ncbi:MAG: hypothetical protein HPM95_18295 [Alphaproteobacteria bacterium]|nr:hypothetical protein [Alphaproteobacteria bacterium]
MLQDGVLEDWFSPRKHGGQKYLYESENLPVNYVEKNILGPIERDFFEARERALVHRQLRSAKDRKSVKRYAIAQLLRQKHLHRRMMHLEDDLIFIGKEIGLDLIWGIRGLGIGKKRRRASSVLANSLLEVDSYEKYLDRHAVIFCFSRATRLVAPR